MTWLNLRLIEKNLTPIISLEDAKDQLRINHSDDDVLITGLISAVRDFIEGPHGLGIALLSSTYRYTLEDFDGHHLKVPIGPVSEVLIVSVDGYELTEDDYRYSTDITPLKISFYGHVRATYLSVMVVAGFAQWPEDLPQDLVQACKLLLTHWYENRGTDASQVSTDELPFGVSAIFDKYRVLGFA